MLYRMTKKIAMTLTEAGYENSVSSIPFESEVSVPVFICGIQYQVRFISRGEDNDVSVRVFKIMEDMTPEQKMRILPLINDVNCRDDHCLCFYIDEYDTLAVSYDFMSEFPDPENYVIGIIEEISNLLKEVCPMLYEAAGQADE